MIATFTLLLACQLVGEVVVHALALPVPGPVVGMLLLFAGLVARGSVPAALDAVGGTLLRNLALLFVPAGVGVVTHLSLIRAELWPLALALLPGTLVAILVTGFSMRALAPRGDGDEG